MIIGAMYAAVLFVGINNCSTVQPIVAIERTVFYRERAAGMYSALPYALAQVGRLLILSSFSFHDFMLLSTNAVLNRMLGILPSFLKTKFYQIVEEGQLFELMNFVHL